MINIVEVLSGVATKTYKFFVPSMSASSTAINNSVLIEFTRQSGQSVTAVTNGLGQCVGYTATNVALASNAESAAVGTVIDFASRQVVVTEELLATTPVVGTGSAAAGATVTEVAATGTSTAMVASTVASVGACVLAAVGGYALGKTVGEYLAEKYPEFWVDTCGKALYEAGCTLASGVNSVITYINPDGQTLVPSKTSRIIQEELGKIGALATQSGDTRGWNEFTATMEFDHYGDPKQHCNIIYTVECISTKFALNLDYSGGSADEISYLNIRTMFPFGDHLPDNGIKIKSEGWDGNGIKYLDTTKFKDSCLLFVGVSHGGSEAYQNCSYTCSLPLFTPLQAAIDFTNNIEVPSINYVYVPTGYYDPPKINPTVSPEPVTIPQPKIKPENAPDDDEDGKAIPVPSPQEVPSIVPNEVFDPKVNPVNILEPVVINPNPYPLPQPNLHVPELPEVPPKEPNPPKPVVIPNMVASALSRVYNPTQAELDALGEYMWSSSRVDDLLKLFQNPADGIVSLHAIYGTPSIGTEYEIKLGYLSTGVSAPVVTSQFVVINCGEITINEQYKNATDYAPYTTIQIYLPFIGIQTLNPFDIVGSNIKCTYKIDVYTGACIAQLNVERAGLNGVIYEFAGNCGYQIPLTSGNYMQAITNVIGGTIGGALIGSGAGAALGAGRALLHSNVDVSRSGNLSANAGILGTREPYFIITRSIPRDALNYSKYYGYPANKTIYLSDCTGFTRVKDIILHTSGTQEERDEIMTLLKHGIYI